MRREKIPNVLKICETQKQMLTLGRYQTSTNICDGAKVKYVEKGITCF